ncbi:MAG TPA: protein kinase [Candidatus Obscuribacterales bacterium]
MVESVTTILIAEDQDIMRLGLKLTLEKLSGVKVIGEAADGQEAISQAQSLRPDVVLMDIGLPVVDGIQATQDIKKTQPDTRIIMFTSDETDDTVFKALSAGADGYALKNISADRLATAITAVMQGAAWLDPGVANRVLRARAGASASPSSATTQAPLSAPPMMDRQLEILQMIADGLSLEQIAAKLNSSSATLEHQLRSILGSFLTKKEAEEELRRTGTTKVSYGGPPADDHFDAELLQPGTRLDERYVIECPLGEGGMSIVYQARHLLMGKKVALKMLRNRLAKDSLAVRRFQHEAKAAGALTHPNLVSIFDFGITRQGRPYLVMDFVDGLSLEDYMSREETVDVGRCLKIFAQVCDALWAAHEKGVLHRDLKPSNIMLIENADGSDLVKLLDFGIAKCLDEEMNPRLTQTGELFGTPLYMSPEHCRGLSVDARSDIYSLGCVIYETISGEPPFTGESLLDVLNKQVNDAPSRLPLLKPGKIIPPALEQLIFKTLEKDPEKRPQTALELKKMLLEIKM